MLLGAFRTTPVKSLEVEANEPPIHLRRLYLSMKFIIKLRDNTNNAAFNIAHGDPAVSIYEKNLKVPLSHVLATLHHIGLARIPCSSINPLQSLKLPASLIQGVNVNLSLSNLKKDSTPASVYVSKFNALKTKLMKKLHNPLELYTDGSKVPNAVGAAVISLDQPEISFSARLDPHMSIMTAEALAILSALAMVSHLRTACAVIYSDSLSCLQQIQIISQTRLSPYGFLYPIVNRIHQLSTDNVIVTLVWIPGHVGIPGNEEADKAAKAALEFPTIHNNCIPAPDLFPLIRSYCLNLWQQEWSTINNFSNLVHSNLPSKFDANISCRRDERIYTRLRLGHTRLTHSYRIEKNSPPPCYDCNERLTIEHILLKCPSIQIERKRWLSNKDGAIPADICQLFCSTPATSIIRFIKEIGIIDML